MPAPILKFVTIFTAQGGWGWTETHWKQASGSAPNLTTQMDNFYSGVIPYRAALLGEECSIVGARVSYPLAGRVASNSRRQFVNGVAGQKGADWSSSLAIEFQNSDGTQSRICHMRGWWDEIAWDETYHGETDSDWTARLTAWVAALKGGYGWLSKDPTLSSSGKVLSYTVAGTGIVTFALDPAFPMPAATIGTQQSVRFSKFHNSKSPLNRAVLVFVQDAVTLISLQPIGCNPTTTTGHYNFRGTSFVAYAGTDSISLGERRMGKPLNRQPGRSKAIPRY